ncbi:ABC transporter ATP-binding protein [Legionella israelensis]|uniref:ABC transporter ATP-binding protein n=1 Tax=Legionella israelensis TaxID=454 RepID=A0AAX1EHA5_9GAMM|nr:ABC transporter ATP-binding protein [Legionella israelensis]QBR84508.1 ABC transporter ATP-binding protein [Legionella israelensis]
MTAYISIENLSIDFLKYHDGQPSLKSDIVSFIKRKKPKNTLTKFRAISNIDLEIKQGDRLGILGKNGAGKSTLLKAIAGIYAPSTGTIRRKGNLVPLLELGTGFEPSSSVRQNIYLNGAILNIPREKIITLEPEILQFAELEEFKDQPLSNLSSGMRSRLSFSISSFLNPEILLLDEVFAAGDKAFVRKAKSRILKMIECSQIVIFTSHQEKQILEICNKAIVLNKGTIVFKGTAAESIKFYNENLIRKSEKGHA